MYTSSVVRKEKKKATNFVYMRKGELRALRGDSIPSTQSEMFTLITSVYIFLGTAMSLIDMMNSMQNQKLLDNGEYMVIHVDMMTYSPREAQKYLWSE